MKENKMVTFPEYQKRQKQIKESQKNIYPHSAQNRNLSYYAFKGIGVGNIPNKFTDYNELIPLAYGYELDYYTKGPKENLADAIKDSGSNKVYNVDHDVISFNNDIQPRAIPYREDVIELLEKNGFVKNDLLFVPFSGEEGDLDCPVNEQDAQIWEAMSSIKKNKHM